MRVPVPPPATASDTDPRSSRPAPAVRRACRVPRCGLRAAPRSGRRPAPSSTRCEIRSSSASRITSRSPRRIRSSVSVSTLESASSRIRILGSRSTARASVVRCFCPPESVMPRSPTMVSYFGGKSADSASDARDLRRVSHFARRSPRRKRYSPPAFRVKRNGSCGTKPIDAPQCLERPSRIERPSSNSVPSGASHSRAINAASVVFPLPSGPQSPASSPPELFRLIPSALLTPALLYSRAVHLPLAIVGYANVRCRNSMSPLISGSCGSLHLRRRSRYRAIAQPPLPCTGSAVLTPRP